MNTTQRVLSILAHPDDAEFLCAGTMILLQAKGWEIHIATMTAGDCGSRDLDPEEIAEVRMQEARESAARIRGTYHCLHCRDLQVCYDPPTLKRTVELVREVNPAVVITHSPDDYMIDHEMTSRLARSACFGAPAPNFRTGAAPSAAATEHIPHLYYSSPIEGKDIFGQEMPLAMAVDISAVIAGKSAMLACHKSQREWLRAQHGIDEYIDAMTRWSAAVGQRIGVEYAEGFRQHLGHAYPQDDLLGGLLGGRKC
jgi:LmbE family N-acetylglucosaminyl deacetylase